MARYCEFKLIYIEVPSPRGLEALNSELRTEDYDAPTIPEGDFSCRWRSPLVTEEELRKLLRKHGISCKFQLYEDREREDGDLWVLDHWTYSSKLAEAKEKILCLSSSDKRVLSKWLKGLL